MIQLQQIQPKVQHYRQQKQMHGKQAKTIVKASVKHKSKIKTTYTNRAKI